MESHSKRRGRAMRTQTVVSGASRDERTRRFVQVVLYVQMAFAGVAGIVGFLAHKFQTAAQEQPLARQVGFLLLAYVVTLWVVSRLWKRETRLLLIPIAFSVGGVLLHSLDALIKIAKLHLPASSPSDIYPPLVVEIVFLTLYLIGYASVRSRSGSSS
jgi:hypothetical protein